MIKKIQDDANDAKLGSLVKNTESSELRLILGSKHIGSWINVWYTMVTGILLAAT